MSPAYYKQSLAYISLSTSFISANEETKSEYAFITPSLYAQDFRFNPSVCHYSEWVL